MYEEYATNAVASAQTTLMLKRRKWLLTMPEELANNKGFTCFYHVYYNSTKLIHNFKVASSNRGIQITAQR
jgi:hypothetical protein